MGLSTRMFYLSALAASFVCVFACLSGAAADIGGIDAMFVATLGLLLVALIPLAQLRRDEHYVTGTAGAAVFDAEAS